MAFLYNIINKSGTAEIVEKKSRFIADVEPVRTEEEFAAFQERIRKKYWDLRHHCFAYVIGDKGEISRCSDDGEPSGTAGRPMLEALVSAKLCNAAVIVSRYFGGVLLGTGGLSRAYGLSAKEGIGACRLAAVESGRRVTATCDYAMMGKIQYIGAQAGLGDGTPEFTDLVRLTYLVPEEEVGSFVSKLTEATSAQALIEISDELKFASADGEKWEL